MRTDPIYRASIVGAGFISPFHAQIVHRLRQVKLESVVDPDSSRAAALADEWGIKKQFSSIEEMLEDGCCDVAHVLVPPPLHKDTASPILRAGVNVLLEKPIATTTSDCASLLSSAQESGAYLGVNQSFLFDPAYVKLKNRIQTGRSGRLHHLSVWLNLPLRQLSAGQFGHWMFRAPQNIVFEQAVHPISQILDLAGPVRSVEAIVGEPRELVPNTYFYDQWQIAMACNNATAQLFMSFGKGMPSVGMLAICEDESIIADIINNRVCVTQKSRWHDLIDNFQNNIGISASGAYQAVSNTTNQLLSILGLKKRTDSFFVSMEKSIEAFYEGLSHQGPEVDGEFATSIIEVCERISKGVAREAQVPERKPRSSAASKSCDTVVIGGTGFIGRSVVRQLVDDGHRVRVMARNIDLLPELFAHKDVDVVRGLNYAEQDLTQAVKGASVVIDLAHGGAGNLQEVRERMIGGAENVARCCLRSGIERLVFASSIAALYLGDASATITDATPPDPEARSRAIYSYGKAECEHLLLKLYRDEGLPVCIVRPGIVIGAGGLPFHSGIGTFVRDKHCIGWNQGNNPLPLVLVEDVATAIRAASMATDAIGATYNLVGDIRLSAREYVSELEKALGRTIIYHPRPATWLQLLEIGKWFVKVAGRRPDNPFPSYRDLLSRGMKAQFDCTDVKRDLNWAPVGDRDEVIARGIQIYGVDN